MNAAQIAMVSDAELFEDFKLSTERLIEGEEKYAAKYPQLRWKHKNCSGSLWHLRLVILEMERRAGKAN